MPIARFKGVFLCSSEDKNFPASHLIDNSNKKWKCEETGIDSAYVVLQLEHPTKISGIDIGNENAAFIEVSVGRNGWPVDKFKTILISSSFMTITESRVSENPNRVRCFSKDALMPDVIDEKWDLVKVTCTQGFNKHVQFGLSFIKVHTADAVPAAGSASPAVQPAVVSSPKEKKSCHEELGLPKNSVFAKFRMRGDSTDSDNSDKSASLFSKWKEEKNSPVKGSNGLNISAAAAIRDAASSVSSLQKCTKITHRIATPTGKVANPDDNEDNNKKKTPPKLMDRYRKAILYDSDDENTSKPRHEKMIKQDQERAERERKERIDKQKAKKEPKIETKKDLTREEQSKNKMESSADKFKIFLGSDVDDAQTSKQGEQAKPSKQTETVEAPKRSDTNTSSVEDVDDDNDDDDDDIAEVKAKSPKKVDLNSSTSSTAKDVKPTNQGTPPAWKAKNKRPSTSNEGSAQKRTRTSTSPEANTPNIRNLLRGVVFVISGIQNPERGDMRSKGLELGAKYKPDWDDSCTHLICAFKNTPKYKQVQGSGIIVNRNWINDCHKQKKKLPWQDYQL